VSEFTKLWEEYYHIRNRARLGLIVFVIAAWTVPIPVAIIFRNRSMLVEMVAFFVAMGFAATITLPPVFRWANWKCPRCNEKFSEPERRSLTTPVWLLLPVLWRLVADSPCARCKLRSGESPDDVVI